MKQRYLLLLALLLLTALSGRAASDYLLYTLSGKQYQIPTDSVQSIGFAQSAGSAAFDRMLINRFDGSSSLLTLGDDAISSLQYLHLSDATVTLTLTTKSGYVGTTFTTGATAGSYRWHPHILSEADVEGLTVKQLLDLLTQSSNLYTDDATTDIAVPTNFTAGQRAYVLAAAIDANGVSGEPVLAPFRVYGPYVDIAVSDVTYSTASATFTPSAAINKYYLYWYGPTEALADYTDDADSDPGTFAKWIGTNKPGGLRPYWSKSSETEKLSNLTPETDYTILALPVTKKSGYVANGPLERLTFRTASAADAPQAEISITVDSVDCYFSMIKFQMNSAGKNFYAICIDKDEWTAFCANIADEALADSIIANGAKYSSSRTVTYKTDAQNDIVAVAVALNDLGTPSQVARIDFTTPAKELGDAWVDIEVSDVTATTARVVCTPSADTRLYKQKEAFLSQWDDIATQAGGIYDYVVYNGVSLTGVDDYTFTNLLSEKTHRVYCLAIGNDGKYSRMTEAVFTPAEEPGETSAEYERYLGTWTMGFTDWVTKDSSTFTVTITPRVTGKSYNVNGLVSPAIAAAWQIPDDGIEARFEEGKLLIYCGRYMNEIGQKLRNAKYDAVQFCGFTKGSSSKQPVAATNSQAAITLSYNDDGTLTFGDNGYFNQESNRFQGFCWITTTNGDSGGRLDTVIPVGLSFTKAEADSTSVSTVSVPATSASGNMSVTIHRRPITDTLTDFNRIAGQTAIPAEASATLEEAVEMTRLR